MSTRTRTSPPGTLPQRTPAERRQIEALDLQAQGPILSELAAAGVHVRSIDDLRRKEVNLRPVVPVLLKHLRIDYSPNLHERLGMAIGMSNDLKGMGAQSFLASLRCETHNQVRAHLGRAISASAVPRDLEDIKGLLKENRSVFWGRRALPLAVGRLGGRREVPFLLELLDDHPAVAHAAAQAMMKLKAVEARPAIEAWATNCGVEWQEEAKKVLKRLRTIKWV